MSLVDVDTWITEYDACERLSRDIQTQIVQRDSRPRLSEEYAKISATVRIRLKQFSLELDSLNKKLQQNGISGKLTSEEAERRHRQLETLQSKLIRQQTQFSSVDVGQTSRAQLFQSSGSRVWNQPQDSDDHTDDEPAFSNETVADLRKQQVKIIDDQNEGLDALSKIISRQKELAIRIGDEVDIQNDIIDDLADNMERTDSRINSETRHVRIVDVKDSTCGYWTVILMLFVAICIVAIL